MKAALRALVAPVARPIWRRVRPRLARIAEPYKISAAWHQLAPSLANAAASVGAIAREQQRMKREHEAAIAELRQAVAELREELDRQSRGK